MARAPVIQPAIGTVNGVNRDFQTSAPYRPGSLRVWINGILGNKVLDEGWIETGSNKFKLNEAPEIHYKSGIPYPDKVSVYFIPS